MRALRMHLSRSLQPSSHSRSHSHSHSHSHSSGALTLAHPHHSLSPYKRSSMVATPHGLICSTTPQKKSLKHRRVKDKEPEKGRPGLQPQPVRFLSQCSETSVQVWQNVFGVQPSLGCLPAHPALTLETLQAGGGAPHCGQIWRCIENELELNDQAGPVENGIVQ